MSTKLDDETLQRYYDGDLSPVEERAVRARIESDPSAQRRLEGLEQLSALIRMSAEEAGNQVASDSMFAAIEQQIEREPAKPKLSVVSNPLRKERRRALIWPLAGVAAAAAAMVVMFVARDAGDDAAARSAKKKEITRTAEVEPETHGTQVEHVDFGKSTGTVFHIENEGIATAVVWITDDEEQEGEAP
jgi:anti-sigma factor RsiW